MPVTKQTNVLLWHYRCPSCGFGDGETGYRAATEAIYCEICLEDGSHVRLKRWPADLSTPIAEPSAPG